MLYTCQCRIRPDFDDNNNNNQRCVHSTIKSYLTDSMEEKHAATQHKSRFGKKDDNKNQGEKMSGKSKAQNKWKRIQSFFSSLLWLNRFVSERHLTLCQIDWRLGDFGFGGLDFLFVAFVVVVQTPITVDIILFHYFRNTIRMSKAFICALVAHFPINSGWRVTGIRIIVVNDISCY